MRNRYPGICYVCGRAVPAKAGHFERRGSGWRVKHASCTNFALALQRMKDEEAVAKAEAR